MRRIIDKILCPDCKGGKISHPEPSRLVCEQCGACFFQKEGIWNLLPKDLRSVDLASLESPNLEGKEGQMIFFSQGNEEYDNQVANSVFWRIEDQLVLEKWYVEGEKLKGAWVIDLGAGTGRVSNYLTQYAEFVVVTDIAPGALQLAKKKLEKLGRDNYLLMACDAENIPFKDEMFSFVSAFGVLHHLENPALGVAEIDRVLRSGGEAFTLENHKSVLRPLFDLIMKIFPIWQEHAGHSPLLDQDDVQSWTRETSLKYKINYRVIIPPHLCSVLGYTLSKPLVIATDLLTNAFPAFHPLAGQIAIEFSKATVPE